MARARHEMPTPSLYEADFYSWALEQARLLREHQLGELDLDNLIDEVEALARGEARELQHRYETLLQHLLKWQFQPGERSRSWAVTIDRSRRKVAEHLEENPGLKPRRLELLLKAYPTARDDAVIDTGLPPEAFPTENPYALEQAMDPTFWPGGRDLPDRAPKRRPRR